jgi:RimJ/RimL family protein N-acetyltransferase
MVIMVPTLGDGVIILNQYTDADIAAHLDGQDDEHRRQFSDPSHPDLTLAEVRSGFAWWAQQWETSGPMRTFAARDAGTGQLVGGCQLELQPGGPAQVSYRVSASQRRRGYATRMLALLLQYARSIGVAEVEAPIAEDNPASRRVSEGAGFRPAGSYTAHDGASMIRYQATLTSS